MTRFYYLRIQKDGKSLYCTEVQGFPVDLVFADPAGPDQPHRFPTEADALETWRLYRRHKPADADGWCAHVEEHFQEGKR